MDRTRAAVTALFFVNWVIFSSFFARLPVIKDDLGASDGQLSLALFAATGALFVAQPLAGALVVRFGAGARARRGGGLRGPTCRSPRSWARSSRLPRCSSR